LEQSRLRRGPERDRRIPLGARSGRPTACTCRRACKHTVAVFVTTGGEGAALAAKGANPAIPIAFVIGRDPVKLGLVASYSRPGGNATGINITINSLEPKRLEILHDLVPLASTIGALLGTHFQKAPYDEELIDIVCSSSGCPGMIARGPRPASC